jgi:hypothetical protein
VLFPRERWRRRTSYVWLAFIVLALLTMIPPWVETEMVPTWRPARKKLWHAPFFAQPVVGRFSKVEVDYPRMLTELAVGEGFVLALYLPWDKGKKE